MITIKQLKYRDERYYNTLHQSTEKPSDDRVWASGYFRIGSGYQVNIQGLTYFGAHTFFDLEIQFEEII